MSERVTVEREGPVAVVRLNRPGKHNGLDLAMFEALVEAGREVSRPDVRAVVLGGNGPSFSAGLDFASFLGDPAAMERLLERPPECVANRAQQAAWVWAEVPVPVVAALHGAVYGGGLQIALAADLRLATPDTRLSVMELRYGLIPDMSITQTLLRLLRDDVARELVYTARVVEAPEAQTLGLVTGLVDDADAAALEVARQIAGRSPDAIRAAKRLLREAPSLDTAGALRLETELQRPLLGSPNQLEAVAASFEKRAPRFVDPSS